MVGVKDHVIIIIVRSCDHNYHNMLVSSATSSAVPMPTVEEVATTDQSEIPDVSVTMVTNKPKEEMRETLDSSSTIDYNSHVSLSQPPIQPQPWSRGMKILLGCKVSEAC